MILWLTFKIIIQHYTGLRVCVEWMRGFSYRANFSTVFVDDLDSAVDLIPA